MRDSTFITRVELKNYKSVAACKVRLHPLVFLVGPNGSGKSNFVDSLRFVADSLRSSLDHALRERGGIGEVRRRSVGHPTHFSILLDFSLPTGHYGTYMFRIGARPRGGYEVQTEECRIRAPEALAHEEHFKVVSGKVVSNSRAVPVPSSDRLFLVSASSIVEFRPVYDALSRMGFYNLNPDRIRELQPPDAGEILSRDGGNLPSVLRELTRHAPDRKLRIEEYLRKVVPGVDGVEFRVIGPKETLEFRQQVGEPATRWRFPVGSMSDGTLRALGVLVSLFQTGNGSGAGIPLVGIEEPEVALHPAAAGILLDSLRVASRSTQILVTSHSPDLLDDDHIDTDSMLAVYYQRDRSVIAPVDESGKSALRDHLCTAGELLRQDQLRPAGKPPAVKQATQLSLFGKGDAP